MSLNDNAVFTAAKGYVFTAPVGTAAPTPAEIAEFEPETFGGANHELKVTGNPTGGTFTITYDTATTDAIPYNATSGVVQAALEKLAKVGPGNVVVTGETLAEGLTIAFIGDLRTSDKAPTATADFTGGSTPKVTVAKGAEGNAWDPIGHTAEEDLPEFGYEGGDKESKGTWQKKNLKEVTTEAVVDYVTMKLNQFDLKTFSYYYGKNKSSTPGVFGVESGDNASVEEAILIIIVDGDYRIGFTAAKSTIRRDESISLATDDFSQLPIRSTFVKHPGRLLFEWIVPSEV